MPELSRLEQMAALVTQYELRPHEVDRILELGDSPQTPNDAALIKKYNTWVEYKNQFNIMERDARIQALERGEDVPGVTQSQASSGFLSRSDVQSLYPNSRFATAVASDALHKQMSEDTHFFNPYPEDGWFAMTPSGALGVGEGSLSTIEDRIGVIYAEPEAAKGVGVPFGAADDVSFASDRRGQVTGRTGTGNVLKGGVNIDIANNIYRSDDIIPMGSKFLGPEDDPSNYVQIGFGDVFGEMTPVVIPVRGRAIRTEAEYEVPPNPTYDPIPLAAPRGNGEDAPPEIYESDYDAFEEGPDKLKGKTRDTTPGSTPSDAPKDPLFVPNLLANIAKGLSAFNLQGVNIPIPDYKQPRYQSDAIGPAVQNLFRGR